MSDASNKIFAQKMVEAAKYRMTVSYYAWRQKPIDQTLLDSYIQHHGVNDDFTASKFDAWVEEMKKLNEITKYK